mmetsp:Transcript_43955/g.111921  ORF Transcript_43955/g.111921 Transcript_43955/m.111921 type:complete len:267 (-) Transcript_43955:625-1425(-)
MKHFVCACEPVQLPSVTSTLRGICRPSLASSPGPHFPILFPISPSYDSNLSSTKRTSSERLHDHPALLWSSEPQTAKSPLASPARCLPSQAVLKPSYPTSVCSQSCPERGVSTGLCSTTTPRSLHRRSRPLGCCNRPHNWLPALLPRRLLRHPPAPPPKMRLRTSGCLWQTPRVPRAWRCLRRRYCNVSRGPAICNFSCYLQRSTRPTAKAAKHQSCRGRLRHKNRCNGHPRFCAWRPTPVPPSSASQAGVRDPVGMPNFCPSVAS